MNEKVKSVYSKVLSLSELHCNGHSVLMPTNLTIQVLITEPQASKDITGWIRCGSRPGDRWCY